VVDVEDGLLETGLVGGSETKELGNSSRVFPGETVNLGELQRREKLCILLVHFLLFHLVLNQESVFSSC
jgi:hypothetical protein